MISARHQTKSDSAGFSLIEVMLALVLVASAAVTLMMLVPAGLRSSRDATDSIIMGHIIEDAHERIEGRALKDGSLDSEPLFYDREGIFVTPDDVELVTRLRGKKEKIALEDKEQNKENIGRGADGENTGAQRRLYRVDFRLVSPKNGDLRKNAPDLKAVILDVGWPVNPDTGDLPVNLSNENRKSITYYVNALTGPGWSEADPEFKPLIEF